MFTGLMGTGKLPLLMSWDGAMQMVLTGKPNDCRGAELSPTQCTLPFRGFIWCGAVPTTASWAHTHGDVPTQDRKMSGWAHSPWGSHLTATAKALCLCRREPEQLLGHKTTACPQIHFCWKHTAKIAATESSVNRTIPLTLSLKNPQNHNSNPKYDLLNEDCQ